MPAIGTDIPRLQVAAFCRPWKRRPATAAAGRAS